MVLLTLVLGCVDKFADRELEICVKFSGDGARFSSSSSFLLLSFYLPGTAATNALSGAGKLSNVSKKLDWQKILSLMLYRQSHHCSREKYGRLFPSAVPCCSARR